MKKTKTESTVEVGLPLGLWDSLDANRTPDPSPVTLEAVRATLRAELVALQFAATPVAEKRRLTAAEVCKQYNISRSHLTIKMRRREIPFERGPRNGQRGRCKLLFDPVKVDQALARNETRAAGQR